MENQDPSQGNSPTCLGPPCFEPGWRYTGRSGTRRGSTDRHQAWASGHFGMEAGQSNPIQGYLFYTDDFQRVRAIQDNDLFHSLKPKRDICSNLGISMSGVGAPRGDPARSHPAGQMFLRQQ